MDTYHFREQLSIDTPEQVHLAFPIAGLGSRILSHLLDILIQFVSYLVIGILIALTLSHRIEVATGKLSDRQGMWVAAGFIFLNFLFLWGYYTLFETFWNGQTPGKRVSKIRVIKDSGRQIALFESMARNFARVVDVLPTAYIAGIITILVSKQNKRLGDLLAGTIVVRVQNTDVSDTGHSNRTFTASLVATPEAVATTNFGIEFPADAIARLSGEDLVLIESFFIRIPELDAPTTDRIAEKMLASLCRKMQVNVPAEPSARKCLDAIAYALRSAVVYR